MKEFIIGAILGYCINAILDKIRDYASNKIKSSRISKICHQLQNLNFKVDADYMAIDHAVPKYLEDNISLKQTDKTVTVPIPENYIKTLEKLGFESHNCDTVDISIIEKSFKHIGIDNYTSLISEASNSVAIDFIKELNEGKIRFNGYLFGVEHLMINRHGQNEDPTLKCLFIKQISLLSEYLPNYIKNSEIVL